MKVARLYSFSDIRVEDMTVPEIGPTDALVRTRACGICSGDVMPWYIEKKAPLVIGHEPAGEIAEIGGAVTKFSKGDRVFVHHHAPCLSCRFCRRGDYVQCATWKISHIVPGGVSEYILIPSLNLNHDTIKLAENISFEDGTLIEPTACVVKGFRRARMRSGDTVLVIGLGVMGMINILLAKKYGAARVIGADMVPFRLQKALRLGADAVLDVSRAGLKDLLERETDGEKADLVIVGPNSVEAMEAGLHCVRPAGQVLFFTPARHGDRLNLDPNSIYFNDISVITSYSCGPDDTRDAYELIRQGVVSASMLVTHRFPIERTAEAFMLTSAARDSLKSVIIFDHN